MVRSKLIKKTILWGLVFLSIMVLIVLILDRDNLADRRDRAFIDAAGDGNTVKMRALILIGAKANWDEAMVSAASNNQVAAINFLLDRGADVNATVKVGWTALMSAVYKGHLDSAKLLLLRGADINFIGDYGTALDLAIESKKTEMIELLKQNGAQEAKELRRLGYS